MADTKKILHVVRLDEIGGVEYLFRFYLERSRQRGRLEHHILLDGNECHPHIRDQVHAAAASISFAKYWRGLKLPRPPEVLRRRNIIRAMRKVQPDVVLSWNGLRRTARLAPVALPGAKTVYYDHGNSWLASATSEERDFIGQVDGVLCVSRASMRLMQLRWGYAGPIDVITNPLRPDLRLGTPQVKRISPGQPIRMGTAGRLASVKGQCLALHAVKSLLEAGQSCELHLAGAGDQEMSLRELARALEIENHVYFHGCIADIAGFYRGIDILVHAALREPWGLVCVEAAASGCVVIATSVDGIPEVVRHGETGLCLVPTLPLGDYPRYGGSLVRLPELVYDPLSDELKPPRFVAPASIAQVVLELVADPSLFDHLSASAIRHAASGFYFDDYVRGVDDFLLEVCKGRGVKAKGARGAIPQ